MVYVEHLSDPQLRVVTEKAALPRQATLHPRDSEAERRARIPPKPTRPVFPDGPTHSGLPPGTRTLQDRSKA